MTSCDIETRVLDAAGLQDLRVTSVRQLHGGMVSRVELWGTDGCPPELVCKRSDTDEESEGLGRQARALSWMRAHTDFPMPDVHGLVTLAERPGKSYLLLERLAGHNLAEARLTRAGLDEVHRQMAEHLGRLHSRRGARYGSAVDGEQCDTWLAWFGPRLESNYRDASSRLSATARAAIRQLLGSLPSWLPESHAPTVVHGDLWHTNIIVDDTSGEQPRITGYIDGGALFADVEYELAYLLVFGMVDQRFFDCYRELQPIREGFERRCLVYWLNTMLLHLWLFGVDYLDRTERLARQIAALA
jgi:fructosamine-3-kinase